MNFNNNEKKKESQTDISDRVPSTMFMSSMNFNNIFMCYRCALYKVQCIDYNHTIHVLSLCLDISHK